VCDEIVSLYAQCAIKFFSAYAQHVRAIIFKNYSKLKMQISPIKNPNFEKSFRNPSNRTQVNILKEKNVGISLQNILFRICSATEKCLNFKILAKIEGKEAKFVSKIYQRHIRI
jgi:hypothetical protein